MNLARRHFLSAIPALLVVPAIVKAESLMPISVPWMNFDDTVAALFRQNQGHDLWYHVRYPDHVNLDLSLARHANIIIGEPESPNCHAVSSWANPAANVPAPPPTWGVGRVIARGRRLGRVPIDDWYLTDFTNKMAARTDRGVWHRRWEWRLV